MKKEVIISFVKNLRLLRTASFLLIYFFGWYFGWYFSSLPSDYIKLILGLISVFFSWQFCISINDIFDIEIDKISNPTRPYVKGYLNKKSSIIWSIILIAASLIFGIFLGLFSFIFVIFFIILGYIYSAPPIRFRKYLFGTIFIGLASAISYFIGIFSTVFYILPEQIMIGVLILVALSIGPIVKDYKDYEGDKKAGVSTIFTKFGLEKGTKITSVLLFLTFLLPLVLIHHLLDFIILLSMGVLVSLLFNYKKIQKKVQFTMGLFFIAIIYIFLRIIGIIII
ncbi:MAG: UbiA family prenyltransferase [Candidatus Helarchaeota archaeon]